MVIQPVRIKEVHMADGWVWDGYADQGTISGYDCASVNEGSNPLEIVLFPGQPPILVIPTLPIAGTPPVPVVGRPRRVKRPVHGSED